MIVLAITQARTGSERLPNKVLKEINGTSLLEFHVRRALKARKIDQFIVATTKLAVDDSIVDLCERVSVASFRGSERNVLDRFYQAAYSYQPDWVVRLTADCPLIDAEVVDIVVAKAVEKNVDYCSNTITADYPNGVDVEVIRYSALCTAWRNATLRSDKEHVTPYIRRHAAFSGGTVFTSFDCRNPLSGYGQVRITVDGPNDFEVVRLLVESRGEECGWKEYADLYLASPEIYKLNIDVERNEGYKKSLLED